MNDFIEMIGGTLLFLLMIIAFMGVLFGLIFGIGYYFSCKEVEIYNKINNTELSCSEWFWGHEQYNAQTQTIRLLEE